MSQYKLPWLRKRRKTAPDLPLKAPIHMGPFSNGEVFFSPGPQERLIEKLIFEKAEEGARRHGIDRREFMASSMGMATALWAVNTVMGCSSPTMNAPAGPVFGGASGTGPAPGPAGVGSTAAIGGMPASNPGAAGSFGPAGRAGQAGQSAPNLAAGGGAGGMGGSASGNRAGAPAANSGGMSGANTGGGGSGGYFHVPDDPTDPDQVCQVMLDASKEFIFDIQTHHVNRADTIYDDFLRDQLQFTGYCSPRNVTPLDCFARNEYTRLMFLESDTTVAVLSGLPAATDPGNPITNAEIAESRDIINMLADGTQRLVNHHMVLPNKLGTDKANVDKQLDEMQRIKEQFGKIGAWKCYPAWSPNNTETNAPDGWFLDDPNTGLRFIQKGIELGIPLFCIHKGLPIPAFSTKYLDPVDVGRAAKMFPMANFVVYHSGYGNQNNYSEGAYMMNSTQGTNSLVTSLLAAGVGPNQNVYAELGTTWQIASTHPLVGGPMAAAHVLGKLLKYVGENNVVWGTDSIWYGSPQSQIETFLQFQIPQNMQMQYGYSALTMDIKRKILGLNAARIYGVNPAAMRCGIDKSEIKAAKLQLDHDLGGRRWAVGSPLLTRRRDFWRLLRRNDFRPG